MCRCDAWYRDSKYIGNRPDMPSALLSTKAVPTAMATGLDIGLSNLSLKTITLSFYSKLPLECILFDCCGSRISLFL